VFMNEFIGLQPNFPRNSQAYLDGYKDEWREVFVITAELCLFGVLIYLILGTGKEQAWARGPDDNKKVSKTEDISRALWDENQDAEPNHVRFVFPQTNKQQQHKDHNVDYSCQ